MADRIRALIVDDEPLGRRRIEDALRSHADVEVVGTAADGAAAIESIRSLKPNLVFLDVHIDADPALVTALVPNMILQPLVENAFKHGLSAMTTGARLDVSATREGDSLVLRVRDNGSGVTAAGEGMGSRITVDRLAALYGDEARYSLRNREDGAATGAMATIVLPYHLQPRTTNG